MAKADVATRQRLAATSSKSRDNNFSTIEYRLVLLVNFTSRISINFVGFMRTISLQDFKKYIVHDFYREPTENEAVMSYPHYRALMVADENDFVVFDAILNKDKKKKKWKYELRLAFPSLMVSHYVTPFRQTKKNREAFNKVSRKVAQKMIAMMDKYPPGLLTSNVVLMRIVQSVRSKKPNVKDVIIQIVDPEPVQITTAWSGN